MTFERAARALIASRAAEGTRKLYASDLSAWLAYCEGGRVDAADPGPEAATAYRDALQARYAPLTVRRVLAALSKMYKAAVGSRAAVWNPFDADALPRPPATEYARTEAVGESTANAVLAAAEADRSTMGVRDFALLRLLYDTGIRRQEVARLERRYVIDREGRLVIGFYAKGAKWHEATLPESAEAALRSWLFVARGSDYVFPSRYGAMGINVATVNKIVTRRMVEAGVLGVHPHQFRAAYATKALDHAPLHEVQASLGHADPKTTLRYDRRARGLGVADKVAEERSKKGG